MKNRKSPNQRQREVLDLTSKKASSLVYFDNFELFFCILSGFNQSLKFNVARSNEAFNFFPLLTGGFSWSGLSFEIPRRLLMITEKIMDTNNIRNYLEYNSMKAVQRYLSGDWGEENEFEEILVDQGLGKGLMWESTSYIIFFFWLKIDKGKFHESDTGIIKLFQIRDAYDYSLAALYGHVLKVYKGILQRNLPSAKSAVDEGIRFCEKNDLKLHEFAFRL